MPLTTAEIGKSTTPLVQHVDARWLMAYAAGLGDELPCYLDTRRQENIVAHPVFPVALEWEPILKQNYGGSFLAEMSRDERARGVHGAHDLHIYQAIRPGDRLSTRITQIGVLQKKAGAIQVSKLESRNEAGELVCTTYMQGLFRGVELRGGERWSEPAPPMPDLESTVPTDLQWRIPVSANQAHVYTECARIWNPIHTDRAIAKAAGLPDIILHGTCTLALATSMLVKQLLAGEPTRVTRVGCRFSGMVLMPSTLTLRLQRRGHGCAGFVVLTEQGNAALSDGYICWE